MKASKSYSASELFSLANSLRKSHKLSQKDAFAMAKEQLEKTHNSLGAEVIRQMKEGNVKFTFTNNGKTITTTGTLRPDYAPLHKRRVYGRREPLSENNVVFYDVRHGVFRQFNKNNVINIISTKK